MEIDRKDAVKETVGVRLFGRADKHLRGKDKLAREILYNSWRKLILSYLKWRNHSFARK